MTDSSKSGGIQSSNVLDFGYNLYKVQRLLFFLPMLAGAVAAIYFYDFFPFLEPKRWRIHFQYFPLVIGVCVTFSAGLIGRFICPPNKQIDFDEVLTSIDRWREINLQNKLRLLLGAIVALNAGFSIGWVLSGWMWFGF